MKSLTPRQRRISASCPFIQDRGWGATVFRSIPATWHGNRRRYDDHTKFIDLAGEINEGMTYYVVAKLQRIINCGGQCLNGAKILMLGTDVGDSRETPAIKVMELFQQEGTAITYVDPFVPNLFLVDQCYQAAQLD
jgi:UDP-N-acetyl-D-glucosamine dehydrogenase